MQFATKTACQYSSESEEQVSGTKDIILKWNMGSTSNRFYFVHVAEFKSLIKLGSFGKYAT